MTPESRLHQDHVQEEAALWFARLRGGELSAEDEIAFQTWLQQSAGHQAAFQRLGRAWELLAEVPRARPDAKRPFVARRAMIGGALAASLAGFLILRPQTAEATVLRTATGEQKRFALPGGSSVFLDTASEVSVSYGAGEPAATLNSGRAHFEVAASGAGRFAVRTGDLCVVSQGGAFDVSCTQHRPSVYLQDKGALVQTPDGVQRPLRAGDRLTWQFLQGAAVIDRPGREIATAWQRGILIFDQTTLADAVQEMNRYSRIKISVRDDKAARLKISGAYGAGKSAEFLHTIMLLLPVRAEPRGDAFEISSSL